MIAINEKMIRFCEEYVLNGFNGSKAYEITYEQKNKNVCGTEASKMLQDPRIKERIAKIEGDYRLAGYKIGINKKLIMERILEQLNAKKAVYHNGVKVDDTVDNTAVNNAVNTYLKLTGDFGPERSVIELDTKSQIDVTKLTDEEKKTLEQSILKEL